MFATDFLCIFFGSPSLSTSSPLIVLHSEIQHRLNFWSGDVPHVLQPRLVVFAISDLLALLRWSACFPVLWFRNNAMQNSSA